MLNKEIEARNENGSREAWIVFIDRFDSFLKKSKITETEFTKLFETAPKVGIHLFIAGYYNYIGVSYEAIAKYVRMNIEQAILSMRITDQSIFAKSLQSSEMHLKADEGYYFYNSAYIKIKYPNSKREG